MYICVTFMAVTYCIKGVLMFRKKNREMAVCKQCGKTFQKRTYHQVLCSKKCRNEYHNDIKAKAIEFYRAAGISRCSTFPKLL
jgi:ribosomal protein L37AE/L43A